MTKKFAWFPAMVGIFSGFLFLIIINKITEKIEQKNNQKK
jgi:hypothetical protein